MAVLFEADILSKVAVPDFPFVEEKPRFMGVVERTLERCPFSIILFHIKIMSYHDIARWKYREFAGNREFEVQFVIYKSRFFA